MPYTFITLHFTTLRDIRSLPFWHGARWNALLRNLCRQAGVAAEDAYRSLAPERSGTRHIHRGEALCLRLMASAAANSATRQLLAALPAARCGEGEFFLGETLHFAQWEECDLHLLLAQEIDRLQQLAGQQEWTIRLTSPLRLTGPPGLKEDGRYAGPDFFQKTPEAMARFMEKIRIEAGEYESVPAVAGASLHWHDMAYSARRKIRLGGVMGILRLAPAELSLPVARALVMGQYVGVGKNGRFGLGLYRIEELQGWHAMPPFPVL